MKFINRFFLILFFLLFFANVVMYVKSLHLASEIKNFETEIENLQSEVDLLQTRALEKESLVSIASYAAELGFTRKNQVLRIDVSKVALKE